MNGQEPIILKIVLDDMPVKQKEQINLLLTSIFLTLFLLNIYLSFIIVSKVYSIIKFIYELVNNYLIRSRNYINYS